MKIKHLILGLMAMVSIFAGCQKEEPAPAEPSMTLTPETLTFAMNPTATQSVVVNSTREWRADNIPDWITVSINGQSIAGAVQSVGEKTVTIECKENTDVERSAQIIFNGGSIANKTLTVNQEGKAVVYNTIAEAKSLMGTQESVTLPENFIIKAVVVSNILLENQTSASNMVIQDGTGGTIVRLTAKNTTIKFGDVVTADLSNQVLTKYATAYQLSNIPNDRFTVVETGTEVQPIKANMKDFLNNKYESQFISIDSVQVADSDLSKTWVMNSSHTSINMVAKGGESFIVFSSKYSSFGSEKVSQGSGTIKGISSINNGTLQIMFGQQSDYAGLTGERFTVEVKTLTIAEVFAKGSGSIMTAGRVLMVGPQGFILNDGGEKNLYVYTTSTPTVNINDFVDVAGDLTTYGGVIEVSNPTVTASTKTFPVPAEQTPVDLTDPSAASGYSGDKTSKFIKIAGELVKNTDAKGDHYNLTMAGISLKGTISTTNTAALDELVGKVVVATGFFIGKTGSYITVIPADVKENTDPYLNVSPTTQKVKATDTTATVSINTNVKSFTASVSPTTATISVDPATNVATVTFPENTSEKDIEYTVTVKATGLSDAVATITHKKPVSGTAKYVKVTAAPTDWSGKYLIVYENTDKTTGVVSAFVFNGKDVANGYATADITSGAIGYSEEISANEVEIASMTGGYSIKFGSQYISGTDGSNALVFSGTAQLNTISHNGNGVLVTSNNSVLRFNSTSNQMRFRYYKASSYSSQQIIQLYKYQE